MWCNCLARSVLSRSYRSMEIRQLAPAECVVRIVIAPEYVPMLRLLMMVLTTSKSNQVDLAWWSTPRNGQGSFERAYGDEI